MAAEKNQDGDLTYHLTDSEEEEQYYSTVEDSDDEEEEYWSAQERPQEELDVDASTEEKQENDEVSGEEDQAPLEVETLGEVPPTEEDTQSPVRQKEKNLHLGISPSVFHNINPCPEDLGTPSNVIQEVLRLRDICLAVLPAEPAPHSSAVISPEEEDSVVEETVPTQQDPGHKIRHEQQDPQIEEPSTERIHWKDLDLVRQLGHGSIARTSLLRHKPTRRLVVVKETLRGKEEFSQREIDFVKQLSGHRLFLSAIECLGIPTPDRRFIREYFPGQSLYQYLSRQVLTFTEVQRVLRQLGEALAFVHSKKIIHLDVNPYNILVNEKLWCRLIDFNCSVRGPHARGAFGTRLFYAPEVETYEWGFRKCFRKKKPYGYKADYYSLGMTSLVMSANLLHIDFIRRVLIKKKKKRRNLPWIVATKQEISPEGPKDNFHDLLSRLLTKPKKRLGDKDFLKHPFFDEFFEVRLEQVQLDPKKVRCAACLHRWCICHVNECCPSKARRKIEKKIWKRNHARDMVCNRTVQVADIMKKKYRKPKNKSLWRTIVECFRRKKNPPNLPEANIQENSPQPPEENQNINEEAQPGTSTQNEMETGRQKKRKFSFKKLFQWKKGGSAPSQN